jgi:LURP-one-related
MMVKIGQTDAAWIAADRAGFCAQRAGSPLAVAASMFRMAHVFLALGQIDQAHHVATTTAQALELKIIPDAEPEVLSLYGALHLVLAVAAARDNKRAEAHEHLETARKIAGQLGEDRDDFGTEFGRDRRQERREERREARTGGPVLTHYQMRQRMISIGDDYVIENDRGERVFKLDGKALRARKTIVFEDIDGRELCRIQERMLRVKDSMEIEDPGGRRVALVQKAMITRCASDGRSKSTARTCRCRATSWTTSTPSSGTGSG